MLRRAGFFGRMLSLRLEFGYWVFEGDLQPIQRPSWNYRSEDGGGMILDMMCHWRYVLDNLFGEVQSVSCLGATHIPTRWDEDGKPYPRPPTTPPTRPCSSRATAASRSSPSSTCRGRRACAATTSSPSTSTAPTARRRRPSRVPRPAARGDAAAGVEPDVKQTMNFFEQWQDVPDSTVYDNGFKIQWEHFIRHVVDTRPYKWTLGEGAKGVQLVEAALESWKARRWIDVPPLAL
jgi:predicted dehydrogenase